MWHLSRLCAVKRAVAMASIFTAALLLAMLVGCTTPAEKTASTGAPTNSGVGADVAPESAPASASSAPTRAGVQAFVESAAKYARENGKESALATFTAPGGQFHQGALYIYAYDFKGNVIAHGGDKALVGKNLLDMKDPNGVMVIEELVKLAKSGSGWLYYMWPNPANGNQAEPKLGYVVRVDDTWFLGSGAYGPAAVQK